MMQLSTGNELCRFIRCSCNLIHIAANSKGFITKIYTYYLDGIITTSSTIILVAN